MAEPGPIETLERALRDRHRRALHLDRGFDGCIKEQCIVARSALAEVEALVNFAKDAVAYAQEIQRGTDPVAQGDAHGCAENIESEGRAALAPFGKEGS